MATVARVREPDLVVDSPAEALPGWPVLALLWGFPVFWLLGATVITGVLLTVVMLSYLAHYAATRFVPGVHAFTAFVVWVVPCAVMVEGTSRLLGYAYRFSILVIVGTAFVYTIAAGSRLSRRRIVDALTFVWFFTVVGGLAGLAFPTVRLSTPVGLLLPSSLTSNEYVHDLFFPPFAEIQSPFGSPTDFIRPSAPFPYANSWGVAIVLLTPVAVACFLQTRSILLRAGIVAGMCGMLAPALSTSNRGMFAGLVLAAVYVVIRMAVRNRAAPVITIAVLGIGAAVVLVANGLLTQIHTRQEYGDSNGTRFGLYEETFRRTLQSPLLGYGAPRPSAEPGISLGTQGYVWMLMFSFGFVGLALFLVFLWGTAARTWRAPGDIDLVLHSVLVVASVIILVYGMDIMQLLTVMLVAAVLLRRRYGLDPSRPGG
ncbi:O-antigen ligase domain-containing protein [Aeromicrobium sp. SMF47]|uniref:O-antigen ligase family protein n=1 Tax=Aeromicrobium TaxID=2040 RepID=UPI00129DC36C|nr:MULTISPECIES: O-antigen ligase family protein [Aeromicrobium]MRJ76358.1 O-antigen ligase domain-containing protein [Aeromicrobium yanjiei]MRK00709.1 O-antigen ligase domain-containing protein [Aeromicrobium sp. S22]